MDNNWKKKIEEKLLTGSSKENKKLEKILEDLKEIFDEVGASGSNNKSERKYIYNLIESRFEKMYDSENTESESNNESESENLETKEIKDSKEKESKKKLSATEFFFLKTPFLLEDFSKNSEKDEQKEIEVIRNLNFEFKKENPSFQGNFWEKFDQEIFAEEEGAKDSKCLGLLKASSTKVATRMRLFSEIISAYEKAYGKEKSSIYSIIGELTNQDKSNILHIVSSKISDTADEIGIKKEDWEVYQHLTEEFPNLLSSKDEYGRSPKNFIEESEHELSVGKESNIIQAFFISRGSN